jgi:hypothetical protein
VSEDSRKFKFRSIGTSPDGRPVIPIIWVPDAPSIERILAAVAKTPQGANLTDGVDRNQLQIALSHASLLWRVRSSLDSKKLAKQRATPFKELTDIATKLRERLMESDCYASMAFTFPDATDFEAFLTRLNHIIQAAHDFQRMNEEAVRLDRAPKDWFVVEILGSVFERNFGRSPTISRDGHFVRFAVAVMKEMNIHIAPETVVRALKDFKAGKPRRG